MLRVAITGAATGLGSVIAKHFLKDGCRVMICDVDQPALDDFQACYPEVLISRTDVSNESEVRRFFEKIGNEMECLDVLVNNAGIAGPTAPIELIDAAEWRKTISVDLDGVFYCLKYAIPLLKQAPAGSIENIASTAGLMGFAHRSP